MAGTVKLEIEAIKRTIWLTRPDLQELCAGDAERFEVWLYHHGEDEYEALKQLDNSLDASLMGRPIETALDHPGVPVNRFMRLIWLTRPDLQAEFDLATAGGQEAYCWWYYLHGGSEFGDRWFLTGAQRAYLGQRAEGWADSATFPVCRLLAEIWRRRPDLQQHFDRHSAFGVSRLLLWFYRAGILSDHLWQAFDLGYLQMLMRPHDAGVETSRLLFLFWLFNDGLKQQFPNPDQPEYRVWTRSPDGERHYPFLPVLHQRIAELSRRPAGRIPASVAGPLPSLSCGFNLIGHAKGQFGLGEDVRMAALACEAAGIPHSVFNISPGAEVSQGDESLADKISAELPYGTNLFCMTGMETARLAAIHGTALFDGRRSIGYWPWELSEWPSEWAHAYDLVDEIWASSRFIFDAFSKTSPKPVRYMPMAVTVEASAGLGRADFGLPEQGFLFVFSFDFLSSLARKNPYACIEAFRRAFPRGDEPVGLVIKAMRVRPGNPLWRKVQREQKKDGRIYIIQETLDRGALLDLYRSCDCFLSLHRSEGFGRGIAEALMLGKPVIATGYGGNTDFTIPPLGHCVDYELCRVEMGEYMFGEGQVWAEPTVSSAASLMEMMIARSWECPVLPAILAPYQDMFSVFRVGATYKSAL
jgi:glycosyltransferase involved in cell wall biosynthesis